MPRRSSKLLRDYNRSLPATHYINMCISILPQNPITSSKNKIDSRNYYKDYLDLVNTWRPALKSAAYMICQFIAGRTLCYHKEWEIIPEDHFLNGVSSRQTGEVYTPGLSLSRSTLHRHLLTLTLPDANGNIAVFRMPERHVNISTGQEIGHTTYRYRLNPNYTPIMLKSPRKKREETDEDRTLYHNWEQQVDSTSKKNRCQRDYVSRISMSSYKKEEEVGIIEVENSGLTSAVHEEAQGARKVRLPMLLRPRIKQAALDVETTDSPGEIVSPVPPAASNFAYIGEGFSVPAPRPKTERSSEVSRLAQLWVSLEREFVTNNEQGIQLSPVMPWGKREFGMMKTLLNKWKDGNGTYDGFEALVTASLTNWTTITAAMNIKLAMQPSLGLFVRCFSGFRDHDSRVVLLEENREAYKKILALKKDNKKMEQYRITGKIHAPDEKRIQREVDREYKQTAPKELSLREKMDLAIGFKTPLTRRKPALASAPKPAYDEDDGIPSITVCTATINDAFDN